MRTENIREVALEEIADLPVHPVADIFPMLAENSTDRESGKADKQTITLAELADSITENGLQEPIVLFETENGKTLLDGRNRRAACILGKIETALVEDFIGTEEEAETYILNLNIDRRDLTPGQRAFAAAKYWEMEAEKSKTRQGTRTDLVPNLEPSSLKSVESLGQRFRVSKNYVHAAHKEIEAIETARKKATELHAEAEQLEYIKEDAKGRLELLTEINNTGDLVSKEALQAAFTATYGSLEDIQEAVKEAATAVNNASNNQSDLRERAAVEAEKASSKERKARQVQSGKSMNSVYGEAKPQEEESSDPVGKLRTRINSSFGNLKQAVTELAGISGGEDDYNFIGRKITEFIDHFESEFGVENVD